MAATRTRKKVDPFAAAPETETPNTEENNTVADAVTVEQNEITLTFKAGTGFDAPWIVVRVPNLDEANRVLSDDSADLLREVMEKTARAGIFFASQAAPTAPNGGPAQVTGRPARQDAPGGQSRQCKHGDMTYKTGVKNGRTWEAFFCPTAQGTPDQCRPNFL